MRNILLLFVTLIFISSCRKQLPIPESEVAGIWKLNGYSNTNYKIEITGNGYAYWFNYNDIFNKMEEFETEYDISENTMRFYCGNSNRAKHTLRIYRNHRDRLYFSIPVTGYDADGNAFTDYNTYYKMD